MHCDRQVLQKAYLHLPTPTIIYILGDQSFNLLESKHNGKTFLKLRQFKLVKLFLKKNEMYSL